MRKSTASCFPEKNAVPVPRASSVRRVLGIDPGLASCGFGVVDFYRNRCKLVGYGVIETASDTPRPSRLLFIYDEVSRILREFEPTEAGMETLFFAKNVTSAMFVAEARGVVSVCLAAHGIYPAEYAPNTIKRTVSGIATADKRSVQEAVRFLLGMREIPSPDHAADALAIAITHLHTTAALQKIPQESARKI